MQALDIRDGRLVASTLPLPQPGKDEVLVRVAYAGTNRADVMQMAGQYAPPPGASPLPGLEVSGWVTAAPEHSGFTVGQEVCALLSGGGYAEYVAAEAPLVLPLPDGVGLKEAAALPEVVATSMMALMAEGQLKAGERVLIHGGSSGLGLHMLQIARHYGAEVYTTVGSAEKAALLETYGAQALQYRTRPFAEQLIELTQNQGVDLIIDTLGGPQVETHLRLLRRGGRMVTLAMLEGSALPAGMKMTRLFMNHLHWCGATLRSRTLEEKAAYMERAGRELWPALAQGRIKPVVDSVFPLFEAEKALQRMQERLHMGKILLEVTAN